MTKSKKWIVSMLLCVATLCVAGGAAIVSEQGNEKKISAYAETLESFKIQEKASVRSSEPNGIRFTTIVDDDTKAQVAALTGATYGTLLIPEDLYDGELTLEDAKVVNIPTKTWQDAEKTEYTSVLAGKKNDDGTFSNLADSYYNRPIVARSYVQGTDAQGNTVTYYTSNVAVRSIGYVAKMALDAGESSTLLNTIAMKTEVGFADSITLSTVTDSTVLYNLLANTGAPKLLIGGIPADVEVSYSMNVSTVASLENNEIVALSAGTATVTATATYNGVDYSKDIEIIVNDETKFASDYAILVPQGTTSANYAAPVTYAANEAQRLIKEATGVTLPIVEETGAETTNGNYISLGATSLASANGVAVTNTKTTASVVKSVGNTLFLCGNTDEGTMYGAYELLGEWLGYEYYAKDTYALKGVTAIDFPADGEYVPAIEYSISPSDDISKNDNLLNRYRMDNWYDDIMVVNGGRIHNTFNILPPFTNMESTNETGNFKTHPKWYTSRASGLGSLHTSRTFTDSYGRKCPYELCFNARGDSAEYATMLSTAIKAYTDVLTADKTLTKASLSIRDNVIWCQCSVCKNEAATDSALDFLNDVCAGIRTWLTENNDPRVDTFRMIFLAYYTTGAVPTTETTLDPYIDVWFAESFAVYTLPMNDPTAAGETATAWTNLQAWAALLNQSQNCTNGVRNNSLLVWTYNSNMYELLAPYDSFESMRVNYGLFADLGVDSVYNYTDSAMSGWASLKKYLASQLTWNANPSDAEWNGWIDGFFTNAYGDGATEMKSWFNDYLAYADTIADKFNVAHNVSTNPVTSSIYQNVATYDMGSGEKINTEFFTKAELEEWIGYANRAISALDKNDANYQTYYNNILLEQLSPMYLLLEIYGAELDGADYTNYANAVVAGLQGFGFTAVSLTETVDVAIEKYTQLAQKSVALDLSVDGGMNLDSVAVFGEEKTIASVKNGTEEVYVDGVVNIATAGVYSVTVTAEDDSSVVIELHVATKVIRTAADLAAVKYTGTNISGYYVLDGDVDCGGATISGATTGWSQNNGFQGIFDGRGYTIKNITVGAYGIFGTLGKATVQNVNFENVILNNNSALIASTMFNSTIQNVSVTYSSIGAYDTGWYGAGLLIGRKIDTQSKWTNITLDAAGLVVPIALGQECIISGDNATKFSNVKIYAESVTIIGFEGYSADIDVSAAMTEYPTGIVFEQKHLAITSIDDEYIAENGVVTLESDLFTLGEIVTVNGTEYEVTTEGEITATIDGLSVGATATVVCKIGEYTINYTNVFAVTQIIDDLSELSVVQATSTSDEIYGYYILGGDIDGNGVTLANTVQIYNQSQGFRGTLDGRGYTISNFNTGNYGIFGNLAYGATLKNITLDVNKAYSNVIAYATRAAKITDVTVNVGAIVYTGWYELASEMVSTTVTNLTVNYAESIVFGNAYALCKTNNNSTFTNVKITTNVQNVEKITNSGTPDGVTVTTIGSLPAVEYTVETETYAEASGATFAHAAIVEGDSVTVTVNGASVTATAEAGSVTADISGASLTLGETYSVVVATGTYSITYTNTMYVTKAITTKEEFDANVRSKGGAIITGYYVLANDINYGYVDQLSAGSWTSNEGFQGTFDGRGHKIDNLNMGWAQNGLFVHLGAGAVLKNFSITNIATRSGYNMSVLAHYALGGGAARIQIKDVTLQYKEITASATSQQDASSMLIGRTMQHVGFTNVTIDASGLDIPQYLYALSHEVQASATFSNCVVKANSFVEVARGVTTWPSGVTFVDTGDTVTTEIYVEEANVAATTFTHTAFAEGDSVTATANGVSVPVTVAAGSVTADLSGAGFTLGELYEVSLVKENFTLTYTNTMYVTKAITTKEEFDANVRSNGGAIITGYYVLANDINYGYVVQLSAGSWTSNAGFQGTFDGRGHKIDNLNIGWAQNGLFVHLGAGAVLKNFSITNIATRNGYNMSVLAHYALGGGAARIQIKDVTLQYKEIIASATSQQDASSMLIGRTMQHVGFTNVTIDASGLDIPQYLYALSHEVQASATFSNCVVKANSFVEVARGVTTWPSGVTYTQA